MEKLLRFTVDSKEYTATLVSSVSDVPNYHWILIRDKQLRKLLGEELAFVMVDGQIQPVIPATAKKHPEYFKAIMDSLKKELGN